ncbi:MAG: hypothetical protein KatS3mg039_0741 [Candidatus Kapaibacterium sp.]|nr:MAG: hypothetical protein KatS3mg039_0741 [Candidatus Kapabacteria bacterium]
MKPLAYYLQVLLDERGLRQRLDQARIPDVFRSVVGEAAFRKVESLSFSNGELVVRVLSPIWRIELRLRRDKIREQLNEQLGYPLVDTLTIL